MSPVVGPDTPRVALVGAGPGDPELLTLKAVRLLAAAEVVLFDRLVSPEILAMAAPGAELIDVGKRPGASHTQELINDLLVSVAQSGRRVVRLKGGDPFVFGRGGEEVEALTRHGIACEVVPGISSALAAPSAAGIPITHRTVSRAFTVVTGHEALHSSPVDWGAAARLGGTLVVLMGIERRAELADRMIAEGLAADTPVAVVIDATTPEQKVWRGRLDALGAADVVSPAVMVIGAVAALPLGELVDVAGATAHPSVPRG
jgi:uroporphyrin-III C-methyltransferase